MIVSIACFTLVAHQQLTVPVAFTALALFGMVRSPMTMLPTSITQLLQSTSLSLFSLFSHLRHSKQKEQVVLTLPLDSLGLDPTP